ncbi:MAG TPA: hypothetical protein VHD32_19320 [Candidatus Didemnitutus sp.]|nr:hypothetical protein [Candidatus Didemnitutus sp.]
MKLRASVPVRWPGVAILLLAETLLVPTCLRGGEDGKHDDLVVAVYAAASPDYVRHRGPDGRWVAETYAFGEGGCTASNMRDDGLEKFKFLDLAHVLAPSLARGQYTPTDRAHPEKTDLLVMVYWGATQGTENTARESTYALAQGLLPPSAPPRPDASMGNGDGGFTGRGGYGQFFGSGGRGQGAIDYIVKQYSDNMQQQAIMLQTMANENRDQEDMRNAQVLGFLPELKRARLQRAAYGFHLGADVTAEVEESRYYVVLLAYDYRLLAEKKERKLRWEVRFSIRERRNDFGQRLAEMAVAAAPFVGRNSDGIKHSSVPSGWVEVGEPQVVGYDTKGK